MQFNSYFIPGAQVTKSRRCGANRSAAGAPALAGESSIAFARTERSSWYGNLEIVVGALLLLSPMFWLFIAELIK